MRQELYDIAFYIEHANGKVSDQSLKAITAASQIEGDVHGLIAGTNIDEAVAEGFKINGLSKLLHLDDAAFDNVLAEKLTQAIFNIAEIMTTFWLRQQQLVKM